jgi:hypothetical protein
VLTIFIRALIFYTLYEVGMVDYFTKLHKRIFYVCQLDGLTDNTIALLHEDVAVDNGLELSHLNGHVHFNFIR